MAETAKAKNIVVKQPRKRIPLGTRNVLTAPARPGFSRRFINDVGDRVQVFKAAGWNVVDDGSEVGDAKVGSPSTLGSLTNPSVGGGRRGVLVEIPEELYAQDRAESQAKITAIENEIKRSSGGGELSGKISIS